jgi:hypothetical protein
MFNSALLSVGSADGGANVAQLAEQLIRNEQVSGSSPLIGFNEIKGL